VIVFILVVVLASVADDIYCYICCMLHVWLLYKLLCVRVSNQVSLTKL